MTAADRRLELLEILCDRRYDTVPNLANEFNVSQNTIRNDIIVLSCSYPIYTKCGRVDGGVYVESWYRRGKKYLTDSQAELLERLSKELNATDKQVMDSIIKGFKKSEKCKRFDK